ncbi:MAG: efflux RND transporter periplasmic adaptor subunit [Desulfamplus sp.]|nr:efflux RND transporter periplasmic adaptor subunit [Desulfamplus sp.]
MINNKIKIGFLVLASFVLFLTACGKEKEEKSTKEIVRPIKMMTVTSGQDMLQRRFPGKVRAVSRVDMSFQVNGPLIKLPVKEGQNVKKGELIARIDPRNYEVALKNAEGHLSNAEAQLKAMRQARPEDIRRMEANLAKADAAVRLAQAEYGRIVRIKQADPGAVSQGMIDRVTEGKKRAEAELLAAKEELRIGKIGARPEDIQAKEAEIKSLAAACDYAELQLSYTYLRAPFDGIISRRYVDNFQEIHVKEPIVSLDDVSSVEILVDVPELIVATFKEGSDPNVVAEFAAAPGKQYPLMIKEHASRANPKTQTYQVAFRMSQSDEINVLPGMTATVTGSSRMQENSKNMFIIPAIAVTADEAGKSNVWIVDKETMKVKPREVKTGNLTGTDDIEIIDGLNAGETIAVSAVSRLREGMQVSDLSKMEGYKQ